VPAIALAVVLACGLAGCSPSPAAPPAPPTVRPIGGTPGGGFRPLAAADHHMHLQSARTVSVLIRLKTQFKESVEPSDRQVLGAAEAVAALDAAGIRRGVVLSGGYMLGTSDIDVPGERRLVADENAWTAAEARRYPDRLVGFCSVNPLKDYAEREVERCAAIGLGGLKLHFTNSAVDLLERDHVERVRRVMAAAGRLHLPILVHIRTRQPNLGGKEAAVFIERLLPAASGVPVVVAHAGGWGGYDRATDAALSTFAEYCGSSADACRQLYFDLAFTVLPAGAAEAPAQNVLRMLADAQRDFPDANERLAERLQTIGLDHVVFGSDWPGMTPAATIDTIRRSLPLKPAEVDRIFTNRAPFLR
jgi:predicted TIM-barrel fold metal-dependent hydrolase